MIGLYYRRSASNKLTISVLLSIIHIGPPSPPPPAHPPCKKTHPSTNKPYKKALLISSELVAVTSQQMNCVTEEASEKMGGNLSE